jgi:hypothetical protein
MTKEKEKENTTMNKKDALNAALALIEKNY